MSLFNQASGFSPLAHLSMTILEKQQGDFPRFRDAYIDITNEPRIVVMTRTGGGNREAYVDENNLIRAMPGFLSDEDDDFDSTFAYWHFSVPDVVKPALQKFIDTVPEAARPMVFEKPMDRFKRVVEAMGKAS